MKKIIKYINFLFFSIRNPKNGLEVLNGHIQVKQNNNKILTTNVELKSKEEIFNEFFPSSDILRNYKKEIIELENKLESKYSEIKSKPFPSKDKPYDIEYAVNNQLAILYYIICRETKPKIVIETGVAYGQSSSFILCAMKKNEFGKLFSIDYIFSPWQTKEKIGYLIPTELRDRWKLEFGTSSKKLKNLLNEIHEIDIFIHDSLHTYQNMKYEFNTVWPHIKKNGFLISDDVSENSAFMEFCEEKKLNPYFLNFEKNNSKFYGGIVQKI